MLATRILLPADRRSKSDGGLRSAISIWKTTTGDDAMDMWDFLKWRRTLGYTQEEAADKLGVHRGTIQHWERGITRVPQAVDLACEELTRRWKQQPEFGRVNLVYADGSVT